MVNRREGEQSRGMKSVKQDRASFVLSSYDHVVLDKAACDIVNTALSNGAKVSGPVPLPSEKVGLCVNRSTHIYGRSKEHFMRATSRRLITIIGFAGVADVLATLNLPSGVDVEHIQRKRKVASKEAKA